jgi:predicted phosphodiesterase
MDKNLQAKIENLSDKEISLLLKTIEEEPVEKKKHFHYFNKNHVKIGVMSDTHIGHSRCDEDFILSAFKHFEKAGVEAIYHAGDILEGMSGRDGHIYELSHVGFQAQMDAAVNLFNCSPVKLYGIIGNHDAWYLKKQNMGVNVGKVLEERLPGKFGYLGDSEADVELARNIKMKLFHANDGTAYAISYKPQKLVESLGGGEKPNIIIEGHYHKSLQMFTRNIHVFEAGTFMNQSEFMRLKKIPSHKGYWILDIFYSRKSVERLVTEFVPRYD